MLIKKRCTFDLDLETLFDFFTYYAFLINLAIQGFGLHLIVVSELTTQTHFYYTI